MQRFCSYVLVFFLVLGFLTKPVLSFWYVNRFGKVINVVEPQVLGSRNSRRTATATPTTRPTTRPTATTAPRPTATIVPTSTRTPLQPTNTSAPVPTNTQTPQPTNTQTPEPTTTSTTTTGTINDSPTPTTVVVQPSITQSTTLQSVSSPTPTEVQENQDQQAKTANLESSATPTQAQQSTNTDSWWKAFTDNLLNKNVEPTNSPSSSQTKPKSNLPPPTNILRIENSDDQVGITQVDEQGNEKKLGDQLWLEIQSQKNAFDQTNIREEQTTDTIRLGSGINKSIVINRNNVSAETLLPVSVDLTTNGVQVETTSGIKRVIYLPDQVVEKSEKDQFITSVDKSKKIELVVEDGVPVYKIDGIRKGKFFGLVPVSIQKQIFVSAEDGRLVKENLSFSNQFLEKTSF